MWLDEMRTTGYQAPRRRRWAPGLPTRAQPLAWSRVGVTVRDGLVTPSCVTSFRSPGRDRGHRRMGDPRYGGEIWSSRPTTASPALAEPADMALGAALDERELRAAVRAGPDEVPIRHARFERPRPPTRPRPRSCRRVGVGGDDVAHRQPGGLGRHPAQELLLDALLVLHPFLDRDADGIGYGEDLVRAETDGAVGGDPAQLAVDLRHRNARAERERDQAADRLDVGHERGTGFPEGDEHLERLAPVVLGDGHVHRPERGLDPPGRALQKVGARALRAALQVLRLGLVQLGTRPLELGLELGDVPERLGELALHVLGERAPPATRPLLDLLRRRAGREHLHLARRVAVHR